MSKEKKTLLLFVLSLAVLILMARIFVGTMNLKIIKCKGEEKGLCLAPARYFKPARVDWRQRKEVLRERKLETQDKK